MSRASRADRLAVVFALVFPTLVTLAYFILAAQAPAAVQQAVYAISKTLQFGFPLVWVVLVRREKLTWRGPQGQELLLGAAFGAAVFAATVALYALLLKDTALLAGASEAIVAKVQGLGIDSVTKYVALAVFYSLAHSLLEEYYWRWYVFAELERFMSRRAAVSISSVGFMAHHVLVLGWYFGPLAPATWLLSLAVAVGGVVWAWLYAREQALWSVWLSHLLVDAGIFAVGYALLAGVLQPV